MVNRVFIGVSLLKITELKKVYKYKFSEIQARFNEDALCLTLVKPSHDWT